MFLKALEIQGFKSFPDRTKITIDKGITAVVGPNGSGKSNISDAIRWVLGETSAKQLRGGGKMENVIFGGTQQRSAMGFASVQLTIDNTDHRLDLEADEVVIGRKYYRSGDSEYSINGQNVRLRDVYELFLDTGIGRDGYSIIGQGRIAEIVGAKSAERREIFEEASGIAKYRYRKNEAERRLAGAEDNLVRLRDILGELEARVGPLEKECEKANRFLELSARRKELEVTLWVDTVQRARDTVREAARKMEIAESDYASMTKQIDALEEESAATREEIERIIMDSDRLNGEIRSITEEIAGADAKIAVLNNDIGHNEAARQNLENERAALELGGQSVAEEKKRAAAEAEACEKKAAELGARAEELAAQLETLQRQTAQSGERRGEVAAQLAELAARQTDWKVSGAAAQSAAESARTRLAAAKGEREAALENEKKLDADAREAQAFLRDAEETVTRLENIKGGLAMKLESRERQLAAADETEQKLLREADNARSRIATLKELERSMDGYQHSVKAVIKAAENRRLRGIIGPVSSILTVRGGYEVAVETALGFAMQNIVVENETAAKAAMVFLRDERAGRATFLPLDTVRPGYFDRAKLPEGASLASDLVGYDKRYENIVTNLLGRIVVVDDINEASRAARQLDYRNRVVTKDGQVVNAGGSFTGGSVSKTAGLFSRKQEIDDLKAKIKRLEQQTDEAQEATDRVKAEVDALRAELTATESEAITAGGDKIRGEMETSRLSAALTQQRAAIELLEAECASLEQRITDSDAQAQQCAAELKSCEEKTAVLEAELAALSGDDDSFLAARDKLSNELSEVRLERLAAEKDAASHRAALEALEQRTGTEAERAAQIELSLRELDEKNAAHRAEIEGVQKTVAESRERIAACEQRIADSAARRMEKEGQITQRTARSRQLTDEREALSREIARLTEQKEAKDAEYDSTVAKLWEEYELSLSDAQELCVEFDSVTELRRLVGEVRGKIRALGNVNVGAIEEYAEVSERYEYMKTQVGDVEKSKAELMKLIGELSDEMRAIFSESFVQINRNFGRIFTELFGGGTAHLSLSDESDVLESGIDIEVAPPGKIIKNLSALSGGEQALVAISIYFAIFAVNPAPFCILDEIEAALDDVNVTRYAQYLRRICDKTQFIVITHRRGTMEEADVLYGVTMQENGVSKLLRLDVNNVDASLIS